MDCPCCSAPLVRGQDLVGARGWLRSGDRYCRACSWIFRRELLPGDEAVGADRCPCHGREAVAPMRSPGGSVAG